MFNEYKYQCVDKAILLKPFKTVVVTPLMKFVPYGIPANTITIISNLFLYIALYLSFVHNGDPLNFLIAALMIFAYVTGDHMDGMQARRTGTGSPLGEFCDHYLDIFNNGIMLIIIFNMYSITNIYLVVTALFLSYISHAAIFFEEYHTKWLIFEAVSSLEGVFFAIAMFTLSYFDIFRHFLMMRVMEGFTLIEIVVLTSLVLGSGTLVKVYLRVGKFSMKFFLYLLLFAFVSVYCVKFLSFNYAVTVITLYNSIYIGNLMKAHLVDSKERNTDFVVPLLLLCDLLLKNSYSWEAGFSAVLYMSVYLFYLTVTVFYPLRQFWFWVNPAKEEADC